jgi:PAS domain S-box-containing protein
MTEGKSPKERTGEQARAPEARRSKGAGRQHPRERREAVIEVLQAMIQASPQAIISLDPQGQVRLWNPAAERLFGWRQAEVLGRLLPTIPEQGEEREKFAAMLARLLEGESFTDLEGRRRKKDGSLMDVSLSAAPLRDPRGKIIGSMGMLSDITARKATEAALARSQARFEAIFNSISDSVIFADPQRRVVMANPATAAVFGYGPEELLGRPTDFLYADRADYEEQGRVRYRVGAQEDRQLFEVRYRRKDGSVFFAETLGTRVKDAQGHTLGFIGIHRDITARKETEETLRQALEISQRRQAEIAALLRAARAVLESSDFLGISRVIFDSCKDLIGAFSGYVALLSRDGTENEVLFLEAGGRPCTVDPSLPMPIRGLRELAYQTGRVVYDNDFANQGQWTRFLPRGHVTLDNVLFAPLVIGGQTLGLLGMANKAGGFSENDARLAAGFGELAAIALLNHRITEERERLIQELETERARLEAVLQQMPAGLAIVAAPSGRLVLANRQVEQIFRQPVKQITGLQELSYYQVFHDDGRPYAPEEYPLARSITRGEVVIDQDLDFLRGDGTRGTMRASTAPIRDREGQIIAAVATFHDVTEEKLREAKIHRLNEELRQRITEVSERTVQLEEANQELEAFSYSVSHDLRAPLRAIGGFSRMLLEERVHQLDAEGQRLLNVILANTRLMDELIDDLLTFSRLGRKELRKGVVNLAHLALGVFNDLKPDLTERACQVDR